MRVHKTIIHRVSTPIIKFNNHDEVFEYTKSLNTEDNIKKLKQVNQRVVKDKPKRNEPCICGSNKKFKKCCINK